MLHKSANSLKSNNLMQAQDGVVPSRSNIGNALENVGNGFHLLALDSPRGECGTGALFHLGR